MSDQKLDLPPGFSQIDLRESRDAFEQACAISHEAGAATLVRVARYDLVEFAVVLEPDEPLVTARRAFFAGMNALADALAVHAPPESNICFGWPGSVLLDGALLGGARLGWPLNCPEDQTPDWLVYGAMLRSADMTHVDPGFVPGATTLTAEGFEMIDPGQIIEGFTRHLMTAFDTWNERGFRPVGEDYLTRLPKKLAAENRLIDRNGDLMISLPAGGPPERFDLKPGLLAPSWYDPAERMPRTS